MNIECPECNEIQDIDGDDLPLRACDTSEYECLHCQHRMTIGWYAVVELR